MKECSKCRQCFEDDIEICPIDNIKPVTTIDGSTTISGRYVLECRLGQGGMGIVFRAKHKFLKSFHAIKIILPSLVTDDTNLLVRFRQEAVLAASIDHPNVIRVTDFGVENDTMPFLVMEYIDGIPLSRYLKTDKPLEVKEAFSLFIPVAQAVAEAHRKGIVHRDLKPENVMVQKDLPLTKAIKVLDFGLAKIKSADSYPSLIQAQTVNICGSPPYMSPEQWKGEGVDHRTDIYALAVLLFQMLTGRLPFQADSMPAMMYQHLSGTPPTAASLGVSLSSSLEAVVLKAMEKDPENRYDSMDDMLRELGNALTQPNKKSFSGEATEVMLPSSLSVENTSIPKPVQTGTPLSDSQRERFLSYFESEEKPEVIADPKLAQDFLEAQDRIESAKTEAINADHLVQELVEAQRQAEEAQDKAVQAKQRIEADVRRQVEAEMQRLAGKDQSKQEAEAKRLSEEVDARRAAEERANYLAQAALEAQQLAESERKQRQEEAQKRELHEGSRREAEVEAQRLTEQVAEARKQYEDAKNEATREAQHRAEAEAKQKKVESELQAVAASEAERRKLVEASAKQYIEEQAGRFEREALAAKNRLEEARVLIEQEAQKREQAEAARILAEGEAERLSQEIVEVQRQMQEMQQHITIDSQGRSISSHRNISQMSIPGSMPGTDQTSRQIPSILLNTTEVSSRKAVVALVIGIISALVLASGGIGLYFFVIRSPGPNTKNVNGGPGQTPGLTDAPAVIARKPILIEGGSFKMGRDDIDDKKNPFWGNQFPAHAETVASFMIDAYETTNAQYAEFVKDAAHKPPSYWMNGVPPTREENFPVTNISLPDAKAYAEWVSKRENKKCRLPTEIQWEYAARNGAQNTSFPWGMDWIADAARLDGRAGAVGSSRDETLAGVKDMLGNVAEWTSSTYSLYKGHPFQQKLDKDYFVVRGLSFNAQKELFEKPNLLLTYRDAFTENQEYAYLGFRLVCEP